MKDIRTDCAYFVQCANCGYSIVRRQKYDAVEIARHHVEHHPAHRVEVRHSNVVEAGEPFWMQSGPTEEEREAMQG